MIQYLKSEDIDKSRWDHCISTSRSPLVYGYSWYLDLVSPGWCGIIEEDYSAVMPLPVKKKYGVKYIIQPRFTQQLGIFTSQIFSDKEIEAFINAIPASYRFVDINLNFSNAAVELSCLSSVNINYELNLSKGIEEIRNAYSENTRRNIQKASPVIKVCEDTPVNELIRLMKKNLKNYPYRKYYDWMKTFFENIIQLKAGLIPGAYYKDELCASVFLLDYGGRLYYLVPVSDKTGKELRAMFAMIDHILQKYAGSDYVLDFEGSNLEGVARFYAGFGATFVNYSRLRINRLPFPLRLLILR